MVARIRSEYKIMGSHHNFIPIHNPTHNCLIFWEKIISTAGFYDWSRRVTIQSIRENSLGDRNCFLCFIWCWTCAS